MSQTTRIAVLGTGPAGSARAAMLARQGTHSLVFDDEKRPAMFVGELLITAIVAILERMVIKDRVAAISLDRPGASNIQMCPKMNYDGLFIVFYERGNRRKVDHPGRFSNLIEQISNRIVALMATAAGRLSSWNRMYLKVCSMWPLQRERAKDLELT